MLTPTALHDAFMELGELARNDGKVIDLAIYGGSALMLASNFRISTRDVDAVPASDPAFVDRLAGVVAARRGWPANWLNDGVRTYLSPNVKGIEAYHELLRGYPTEQEPGLRVFVPTAEYLLAMKLMAMRLDPAAEEGDLTDILGLLDVVGLKSRKEAASFAARFYPEAAISGRLQLGLRELWRLKTERAKEHPDAAPAYLGRTRPPA